MGGGGCQGGGGRGWSVNSTRVVLPWEARKLAFCPLWSIFGGGRWGSNSLPGEASLYNQGYLCEEEGSRNPLAANAHSSRRVDAPTAEGFWLGPRCHAAFISIAFHWAPGSSIVPWGHLESVPLV